MCHYNLQNEAYSQQEDGRRVQHDFMLVKLFSCCIHLLTIYRIHRCKTGFWFRDVSSLWLWHPDAYFIAERVADTGLITVSGKGKLLRSGIFLTIATPNSGLLVKCRPWLPAYHIVPMSFLITRTGQKTARTFGLGSDAYSLTPYIIHIFAIIAQRYRVSKDNA